MTTVARVLHIVKSAGAAHPWDLLAQQTSANGSCAIVLIQNAVAANPSLTCPIFALAADVQARGVDTPHPRIDDKRLLAMIWEAERVVVW